MINKHSAHLNPLPFGIRTWLWRYTYLLLLISMLWHRQAIFESKGDELSSSAECRIQNPIPSRQNACWQTDWAIEDQAKKPWTRQPVPMISKHSAHLTPLPFGIRTWLWRYTYLLLLISMLWLRKAIFESKGDKLSSSAECRIRTQRVSETQSPADWMPADKPTELSRIKLIKKLELDSPSLWSASIQPTWLHCHLAFAHGSGDIYILVVVKFDALAQSNDFRIERRQVVFLCWMQDSYPEGLWNPIPSRLNACWQTDWAIEDQAKTWIRQPVPMISKHSAHLTPLPFAIRTWLWRYTYLLLLISMLWHRQAIFESKEDKLSSSAECRIRTQRVSETQYLADWMPADKPTELSRIKLKKLYSTARPYDQQAFSPPESTAIWHSHLALAIYIFVVVNFDALAQASDFRIERRRVVFLCWMQDSKPNPQQTECLLTNRLSYRGSS